MRDTIEAEAKKAGFTLSQDDTFQGQVFIMFNNGTGWRFNQFNGHVIRTAANWDVTGMASSTQGGHDSSYVMAYSEEDHVLTLEFDHYVWRVGVPSEAVRILNSQGTGEFTLRTTRDIRMTLGGDAFIATLKNASFLYFRDTN